MSDRVTLRDLQQMKDEGRKIVGVVAWDHQIARIVDRAGVDLVSVGDTVGVNLWGHSHPFEVTMDEMIDRDGLHMTDRSYLCLAEAAAGMIANLAQAPIASR